MALEYIPRTSYIGGVAGSLDDHPSATLQTGNIAHVSNATVFSIHYYDAASSAAESSPNIIAPDDIGGGNGRWLMVFSKGTALTNLLGGHSAFGSWSNSDTNKGLSRGTPIENVALDSGSTLPVVGETLSDEVAAAAGVTVQGKVISITDTGGDWGANTGTAAISLGACVGRFSDNATLLGSTAGANCCTLNMLDIAAGVDEIRNSDHWVGAVGAVPPKGWTVYAAGIFSIFDSGDGAPYDKCLKIEVNATPDANPGTRFHIATVVGRLYTLSVYFKKGTAADGTVLLGSTPGGTQYERWDPTDVAWTEYTTTFEATGVDTYLVLRSASVIAGQTALFDEISLYEITPCCTEADSLGPDGWGKDSTLDIYRQHNDGGTLTYDGAFYSLKFTPSAAGDYLTWPLTVVASLAEHYQKFAGKTVTFGAWIKTSTATHMRLRIVDSTGSTYSSYHTGGGGWEWLEATHTADAALTSFNIQFRSTQTSGIVYISQPMFVFSSSIGEGNYVQLPGQWVDLEAPFTPTDYNADSVSANASINLEAQSEGKIPKGSKAVDVNLIAQSAATDKYLALLSENGGKRGPRIEDIVVANKNQSANGVCPCDTNGDIYIERDDTFTATIYVNRVQVS